MKKVFIFCESDPNKEPRMIRTVEALESNYEITFCGYFPYGKFKFIDLSEFVVKKNPVTFHLKFPVLIRKPISGILNIFYYSKSDNILNPLFNIKKAISKLKGEEPKVMICHGLGFLQLCAELKNGRNKLILNAHEYYPAEFEDKPEWKETGKKYNDILNSCDSKIDLIFAVNSTIGKRYQQEFKIKFIEIINAPDFEKNLSPSETMLPVKFVHHGVALRNRKIELMIEAVLKSKNDCELHLILVQTEKEYYEELRSKYSNKKNIIFSSPVGVKQIASYLNKFDVGLFYLEPVNYNWLHALPNKLFEFIQARLAVIVSPNPEMKKLVDEYQLGFVTAEFTEQALLNSIDQMSMEKVKEFKLNSHKNAEKLSSIKVKETMLIAVDQLCAA